MQAGHHGDTTATAALTLLAGCTHAARLVSDMPMLANSLLHCS